MKPEGTLLVTACLIAVGLTAAPTPIAAERQGPATVPVTTPEGFTVDVPPNWQAGPPSFNEVRVKGPTPKHGLTLIDEQMGVVPTAIKMGRKNLTEIPHDHGTIYFQKAGREGLWFQYSIYVVLGERSARMTCVEPEGNEQTSTCLTIARSARFVTRPSTAAPAPSPTPPPPAASPAPRAAAPPPARVPARRAATAPVVTATASDTTIRMPDGFTITLPAGWRIVGSGSPIEARSADGLGRYRYGGELGPTMQHTIRGVESSPLYVQMALPRGRAFYMKGEPEGRGSRVFLVLDGDGWMFDCTDPPTAIGTCLSVVKSARVDAAPAPAMAPTPASDDVPRGSVHPGPAPSAPPPVTPAAPVATPPSAAPQPVAAPPKADASDASAVVAELSKDPRLGAVSAYNRERALKEADGSYGYCLSNVTLKNTLDCACYTKAFFTARLAAGFDVPTVNILNDIVSGKISVKACVVPEKIQHYATNIVGRAVFATLRASEAQKQKFTECVERVAVERFMRNPVPEIQLLDAAASHAFKECQRELRP